MNACTQRVAVAGSLQPVPLAVQPPKVRRRSSDVGSMATTSGRLEGSWSARKFTSGSVQQLPFCTQPGQLRWRHGSRNDVRVAAVDYGEAYDNLFRSKVGSHQLSVQLCTHLSLTRNRMHMNFMCCLHTRQSVDLIINTVNAFMPSVCVLHDQLSQQCCSPDYWTAA